MSAPPSGPQGPMMYIEPAGPSRYLGADDVVSSPALLLERFICGSPRLSIMRLRNALQKSPCTSVRLRLRGSLRVKVAGRIDSHLPA